MPDIWNIWYIFTLKEYIFFTIKKRFRSRCCSFLINRCFQFYLYRRLYYNPSQYLTCTINIIRKFEYLVNALSDMNERCGLPQFWEKHACCMRFSVSWKCAEFSRVFLFLLTLLGRDWKEEKWISSRFSDNSFVGGKIWIDPTSSVQPSIMSFILLVYNGISFFLGTHGLFCHILSIIRFA